MPALLSVYITLYFDENIEKVNALNTDWTSSGERHLITPADMSDVFFTVYPKEGYVADTVDGETIKNNTFTEVYQSDIDTSYTITSKKSGGRRYE